MSTKEWVYQSEQLEVGCYQEITFEADNENPAVIQVVEPEEFEVIKNEFNEQVSVAVPAHIFDEIAIAWCKKRGLQGSLGGPVGGEFGAPDCPYE